MPKKIQKPILAPVINRKYRWMAGFASSFAHHDWEGLKERARRASSAGISPRQLYELALQGYLFLGFPAAIEAFGHLDGSLARIRKSREPTLRSRVKKGRQTCRIIYREKYPALMRNLKRKSPDLARWVIEEGYGKVLSRPGAPLVLRELFSAALLSASGFPRQLFAHLRALVEMGEKPEELARLVKEAAQKSPPAARRKVEQILAHFTNHRDELWRLPVSSL